MTTTNITPDHLTAFDAVRDPDYINIALFSCFLDGKPTAAIVAINEDADGQFTIRPLFVSCNPRDEAHRS